MRPFCCVVWCAPVFYAAVPKHASVCRRPASGFAARYGPIVDEAMSARHPKWRQGRARCRAEGYWAGCESTVCLEWCRERESNPHALAGRGFKSRSVCHATSRLVRGRHRHLKIPQRGCQGSVAFGWRLPCRLDLLHVRPRSRYRAWEGVVGHKSWVDGRLRLEPEQWNL